MLVEQKHENREFDPPVEQLGAFIGSYRSTDKYIVSVISAPLASELRLPRAIRCSPSVMNGLQETNMWLSAGGTVSTVHNDADSIINCLLEGTKTWRFVSP